MAPLDRKATHRVTVYNANKQLSDNGKMLMQCDAVAERPKVIRTTKGVRLINVFIQMGWEWGLSWCDEALSRLTISFKTKTKAYWL